MKKNVLYFFILFLPLIGISQVCNPISTLDCSLVEQQLPISFDFSNLNGNLSESGFSMVLEPSARLASDVALATIGVPGYAPSLIAQSTNGLSITSTKGIFFSQPIGSPSSSDTNSQMNALGVGFVSPTQEFDIKTSLVNPDFSISSGNNYQQTGVWFGVDEDHYVKLAVAKTGASTKNMVFEIENLSGSSPIQTISTGNIANASVIKLHLKVDPINNIIKAYYTLDNSSEILIGELEVPTIILQGASYDQSDLNKKLSFTGIYTSHRRASVSEPINVTFKDFSVEEMQIIPTLSFDKTSLDFVGIENTNIASKSVNLLATTGTPSVVFSDDPDSSSWLILPSNSTVGQVSFGIQPNLAVGVYSTTVFAIDQPDLGYTNAEIAINLEITAEGVAPVFEPISLNFSRLSDTPPAGYITDSGLGYGNRGNGFTYGWVSTQDGVTPINISSTARNRNVSGVGILENTLLHMQYDDVKSSGQEGVWEIQVPNGVYSVTVGVGDPQYDGSQHTINAEGQNIINQFVPVGVTSGSGIVNVLDGRLTIDANGGFNTKINFITIEEYSGVVSPSIVSLNPIDGSTSVPIDAVIATAEIFSPNSGIDITSVTTATVQLFEQGSATPLPIVVNGTESSIEITPTAPLAYNTTYVVDINGVMDLSGELFEAFTSTFTTVGPPRIVSLNPIDGSTSVPIDAVIATAEIFSPNSGIDITSVTTATVQLFEQGSATPLPIVVNGTASSIEIIPTAPLAYNTTYVVDINGVMNLSGELLEVFTSAFTTVSENGPLFEPISLNFSRSSDTPPAGYITDSGLGYGNRGNGFTYGWVSTQDGVTPIDISSTARNRNVSGVGILENTLLHMQYDDVKSTGQEGVWEIQVPNGVYSVAVGVGDPSLDDPATTPMHTINAEGQNIIDQYVPVGSAGATSRFTSGSGIVSVVDGKLTIDANGGFNTKINFISISYIEAINQPYFTHVTPANNSIDVQIDGFQINVEIVVPSGYELTASTIAGHVNLYEVNGVIETLVPSNSNDTGGGDAITLTPTNNLNENTTYIFRLTSDIQVNRIGDVNDIISFIPFESQFTTGENTIITPINIDLTNIEFIKVSGETELGEGTTNERFSSLAIGPDGKLYGSTIGNFTSDGKVFRWTIETDGTLSNLEILSPNLTGSPHPVNGARANDDRLIIGFAFDPNATAENLVAYVTHSAASITAGPEWDGKLTKLSGPNLGNVEDIVIHLPRSLKDHLTNSIAFDSQGDMYISQGSNTAGGEIDPAWGLRPERLLAGAILKLDLDLLPTSLPISAYTTNNISVINTAPVSSILMSDGTYNPYAINSPLTIFATGIRNSYDLVWHTNGWLYMPTNGTAGNDINSPNAPSTANYPLARRIDGLTSIPSAPAMNGGSTQKDWLFKSKGGSYHGHPNPYRGEFVLNHGGVSYSGIPGQVEASHIDNLKYAPTVLPDPNYRTPAYDFGFNKSPNGVIEYRSDAFGGRLQGLLMVTRFSGQDDIMVLLPDATGDIAEAYTTIPGLSGFDDPLDVVEDPLTGNVYVSEYDRGGDGVSRLTLLRAAIPATILSQIAANPEELIFEATNNLNEGQNIDSRLLEIVNQGTEIVNISSVSITGAFSNQFEALSPSGAQTINPGESLVYTVTYAPDLNNNDLGYQEAAIEIISDDENNPIFSVGLHALKKAGYEGTKEPALQDVVDALGIAINVGWTNLANGVDPDPIGDEVEVELWVKTGLDPVTITPVGRYSPAETIPFGWYVNNMGTITLNEVGVLANGLDNAQTLFPPLESGIDSFDPQEAVFGFYTSSNVFNRVNYTEDAINTGGVAHRTRVYPIYDRDGNPVVNSYLVTFEDASNGDYQDYMFVIENIIPYVEGNRVLDFNQDNLNFTATVNQGGIPNQNITLTGTEGITSQDVTLVASEDWVTLPSVELSSPMEIGIDVNGLSIGNYSATITASAVNYQEAVITINLQITNEVVYTYQFNFQDPDNIASSPEGYIDDIGTPYGIQTTGQGDITFGWVLPGTYTPAEAGMNGRNRGGNALLGTLNIIGHRSTTNYPLRDWLVNVPNGTYQVNISVGDPTGKNSNHILDVNGTTVINYDQENAVNGPVNFESTEFVKVVNGRLRLSLGTGGVNVKTNYIRLAPFDENFVPPVIIANFEGNIIAPDIYRGSTEITLEASDRNDSGITSLEYVLDGSSSEIYTSPISVTQLGSHNIQVTAVDGNGNTTVETFNFTIEAGSGALLAIENMTKVPGTNRGFPADDYFSFSRIGNNNAISNVHDTNTMRLNNVGTTNLEVTEINLSNPMDYTFELLDNLGAVTTLPLTIPSGTFADVVLTYQKNDGPRARTITESIEIVSNADNIFENTAILHGAYQAIEEGNDEITSQDIFDVFGFQSSMLSIVNDAGTITPPNDISYRPSANFPREENINLGYEGDMILADAFVQADPSKPVIGMQIAAFHGGGSNGAKLIQVNGTGTVAGMQFNHNSSWYQSILPKSGSNISFDTANTISEPFRIAAQNYLNTGGNNINGNRPDLLGLRVFKVIDHKGNIIPNEYIAIQDFIGSGCTAGSGSCDWNDNIFYFINIKPERDPSAPTNRQLFVLSDEPFNFVLDNFIDKGYAGNKLEYSVTYNGETQLPNWIFFNKNTSQLNGFPETTDLGSYDVLINGIDLNGMTVSTTLTINVVEDLTNVPSLLWIEDFEDISNGDISDMGNTAWTSEKNGDNGDIFSVQNNKFMINGSSTSGVWTSEVINFSGVVDISIDVDDLNFGEKEDNDFIKAYYSVDGGAPVLFGQAINDIPAQTFSVSGLAGSTLQIIVEAQVSWINEYFVFDNVSVVNTLTSKSISSKNISTLALQENNLKNFRLFPNPASDYVWISPESNTELNQIYVYDITGRIVLSVNPKDIKRDNKYLINISNLNSGTYLVKTSDSNGGVQQVRLIVK